jgi:hypothetical protein
MGGGGRERMGEDGSMGVGTWYSSNMADTPGRIRDRHGTCTALSLHGDSIMGLWDSRTPYRLHHGDSLFPSFPLCLSAAFTTPYHM